MMRPEDRTHGGNIDDLYALYVQADDSDRRKAISAEIQIKVLALKYRGSISYGKYPDPDKVLKKVGACLKKKFETGEAFRKYLCKSINRMIGSLLKKQTLEEKNGGITLSEYDLKNVSKLEKISKRINPNLDNKSFIEEAKKELKVKKEKTVINYLQIMTGGERVDEEKVPLPEKSASPEKEWSSREEQIETLRKIEATWNKKPRKKESDRMLSELLTVWVLYMFDKMEKDDLDYDFIDRTILNDYFALKNYRFPEAQEIAEKYGYTDKSAATQNLKRFGKKIGIEFKYPRQPKKS
ncbi:hypothetical protein J5690_05135 [bacterium]|nr:hypothetical protein [bacterium]